jgi:trehalose 6-phosphate synthase/phosphatase
MTLVVLSNRLPFTLFREAQGRWTVEPGSGGLVTALRPVLQNRGGTWIGWPGVTQEELDDAYSEFSRTQQDYGYDLVPVPITASEREDFYFGFSNEVLWPLFHDLPSLCRFRPRYWSAYQTVNRRFAEATKTHLGEDDFVWIHDYQLIAVARELRSLGVRARTGFFLHIPFPSLDIFLKLPWRFQVLHALLDYDLVGFQTVGHLRNFLDCVRRLLPEADVSRKGGIATIRFDGRHIRAGSFPISIDVREFERLAADPEVAAKVRSLREDEPNRKIVLGIDRLDYIKGIPLKLEAFRSLLLRFPELAGQVTLFQVVLPSREDIPRYQRQKVEIERLVGEINGQFTRSGWVPVHYIYRNLEWPRLPAYYLAADVALVTPLKDGMNLVAKEYCATRIDGGGALVLSEFAGAAVQLQGGAWLVNPYDIEGVAEALGRALRAGRREQRARMRRMRRAVADYDIYRWVDAFLDAAIARDLHDFPIQEEYLPEASPR